MRLTLPRLDTNDPADLLAGLRGITPLPAEEGAGLDRLFSLGACITYSFTHLAEETRRLIPAVSLFHGIADINLLTAFSATNGVPDRFAGVSREQWTAVLEDAARVGLLTVISGGIYQIHPALPSYLAAQWHAENPTRYGGERVACEQALCTASADFSRWLSRQIESGDAALAYALIGLQRRTLGAMLGHALDHHVWDDADNIVRALDAYWDTRGLGQEATAWADRVLHAAAGPGDDPPAGDTPAGELWLYTTGQQANRQKDAGQLDQAEQTYQQILAYLQDQPQTKSTRTNISVLYHQLGMTAEARGRLDEADDWYRRSIRIREELGLRDLLATDYHQLGITAQMRGQLDEAGDWYRKALTIKEELGNRPSMALTYGQLGLLAEARQQPGQALEWTVRCVTLFDQFPHPATGPGPQHLARLTRQLGMTALEHTWQQVTGQPVPQAVHDYLTSHHDEEPGEES
jgi:tetratricopeptide (TPR) repeat protein